MLDRSNEHALLRYLPSDGCSVEGQSPDQYMLIRVVYSVNEVYSVVVIYVRVSPNCDSVILYSRENLVRVAYMLGAPNVASDDECWLQSCMCSGTLPASNDDDEIK